MWETVVPALSVLAAEAVIRRKINALPPETFPLRIGQRVQLRRAYNRGLLCSKLADRPKAATALQTVSVAVLAGMTAVCWQTSSSAGRAVRSRTMCIFRGRSSRFSGASSGMLPI